MVSRRPGLVGLAALLAALTVSLTESVGGQSPRPAPAATAATDPFAGLSFRNIGPATMGGRVDDLAVLESNPAVFYVGTATGGLWKTTNMGITWEVLFDDLDDAVSIGDIAIAKDDANLVWVGTGENNNRQSGSWGNGVYKSTDGGKTWKHMGLRDSKHIARIIVDPVDHDVVYVAALGSLWGAGKERGVFKSTDGGLTWTNVLLVDEDTGATELVQDPSNNKVLYAATYQRRRATWGFNGGGPGSGIHKSSDAGRTWTKLTNGIPSGPLGRIGMDVYRANPNIVYARIEHQGESGTYRSDDGGLSWRKMSNVNPRPMYFSQIRIDPTNDLRIYVLGVQIHISDDGGKTFIENGALHSDHHAMWINPANPNHIIDGTDGGIGISWDKGKNWEGIYNMDLGQYYHVGYDMETPYNLCGGLQDNYTWCGPSAVRSRNGIVNDDWFQIQGGDGFEALVDPNDSRTIYAESQDGNIVRVDRITNERKTIRPLPGRGEPTLRWNWNTAIHISPHNSSTIFVGANKVFRSTDRGQSWQAISEDLTQNVDRETLSLMGVTAKEFTIAKHDGVQSYGNLVQLVESPKQAGIIYAGSDDGVVHMTRDNGKSWTNLNSRFPNMPKNCVRVGDRGVRARREHGLRRVRQSHQRRLQQLRLCQRRRRQQLPVDQRGPAQRPGSDDGCGRPQEPGRALRGDRVRVVRVNRSRRQLEPDSLGAADGADSRDRVSPARQRHDSRHARAQHLDSGRRDTDSTVGRGDAQRRVSIRHASGGAIQPRQRSRLRHRQTVPRQEPDLWRSDQLLPQGTGQSRRPSHPRCGGQSSS